MTEWYSFIPADTLYFKGAEPMTVGENHTASLLFPPPVSTLSGALRTAVLRQHSVSFFDYGKGKVSENIIDAIGSAGKDAPFDIIGPLFLYHNTCFIPAPYNWYKEKEKEQGIIHIYKGKEIEKDFIKTDKGSKLYWAKSEGGELETLGGKWISLGAFESPQQKPYYYSDTNVGEGKENRESMIVEARFFYSIESRTGIALEKNRTVKERHLYTFNHVRLKPDVQILFGSTKSLPLDKEGVLKLGAEQRFGRYRKRESPLKPYSSSACGGYLSLSVIKGSSEANDSLIATGKTHYVGGWDMKKNFHKPMEGYFPAGSVFCKKLNDNFLSL